MQSCLEVMKPKKRSWWSTRIVYGRSRSNANISFESRVRFGNANKIRNGFHATDKRIRNLKNRGSNLSAVISILQSLAKGVQQALQSVSPSVGSLVPRSQRERNSDAWHCKQEENLKNRITRSTRKYRFIDKSWLLIFNFTLVLELEKSNPVAAFSYSFTISEMW